MSTAKVIFTYKRKRLSSCSGVGLACPNFSSDVRTGKQKNAPEQRSEKPIEDEKVCQAESFSSACSSPQSHRSSIPKESSHVEGSDTISIREAMLSSREFAGDDTSTALNVSAGASSVKSHRDSCLDLNSSCLHDDEFIQGDSVSQAEEKDTEPKQSLAVYSGTGKAKLNTPLLTFSRRLKRKCDTDNEDTNIKLSTTEGTTAVKDNKPTRVSSGFCEVSSKKSRLGEGCINLTVASDDTNMRDVICSDKDEVFIKEVGDFPCSCTRSHNDIVILRHTKRMNCSVKDLNVDSSANAKQILADTANFSKENVDCSSNIGIGVSYGNDTYKTNKEPVSNQIQRASSGDSQLTSSDGSDSKMVAGKTAEHKASSSSRDFSGRPPGGFVIDCNVIPETNLEEQASGVIHDSFGMEKNHANLLQGHLKIKSLELFPDSGVEADDSRLGKSFKNACSPLELGSKPNNKLLQLFSTDGGKSYPLPPADIRSKFHCSKAEGNSTFSLDSRKDWHEQSSRKASTFHGLFSQTEPIVGQSSRNGASVQAGFMSREITQNTMFPPFPDHSLYTFRHKLLLETINAKASALRGNMNVSLDKFEPCPIIVWSEEELDSLWKGVRRHGRGNWHAMLLDPRLLFAPWRTARDLADQWEREQFNLLSGQRMTQGTHSNLPQPCNLDCNGGFSCPRRKTGSVLAETQLSLGDVYAQKGSSSCISTAQSYGIIPPHNKHLRMASCGLLNNLQNSVALRGDGFPDRLAIGLAMNNNNGLRGEAPMASVSALSHMGGPQIVHPFAEPSRTYRGPRNPFSGFHHDKPSTRKRVVNDNLIVIDSSDASSEETVSDDHHVKR